MTPEAIDAPDSNRASEMLEGSASVFSRRSDVIFAVVIGLTLVAAVWLRWVGLNAQSLWADEGFTTWFSQFSPGAQWHVLRWDDSAPLFYVLVHYWVAMWGSSETAFRALSALFSTLALGVFYLVARQMWQSRFFIVLGLMLYSFSFFQIWYAKEARCYALFGFLLLSSLYFMLLCLKRPSALRLGGLVLALSATLYTHNIALYYLPGFVALCFIYPS
jgi:mannosyltransferase